MSQMNDRHAPPVHEHALVLLDYIDGYQRAHDRRSPSQRRISADLGLGAPTAVQRLVQQLVRTGLLTLEQGGPGMPLALTITSAGQLELRRWRGRDTSSDQRR